MTIWPSTSYTDFPTDQTFNQFHDPDTELDIHRITSGFHWAFVTGAGNAYPSGHLVPSLFGTWFVLFLLMLQSLRQVFPILSFLDISPWIPLVTFPFCLSSRLIKLTSKCVPYTRFGIESFKGQGTFISIKFDTPSSFQQVPCLICGRQSLTVTRHEMICLD